jgi:hypothetical protein
MTNEVHTNDKIENELQFTRYLYEKDEVKLSLIMCILNKKDDAIFWAYELYYSGFQNELVTVFWSLYYDFYYTLNPSFEKYLQTKLKNNLVLDSNSKNCISMIVNNFMIRPHNMDVFILKQLVNICDFDKTDIQDYIENASKFEVMCKELLNVLRTKDYMMLASYILTDVKEQHIRDVFKVITDYFVNVLGVKIDKKYLTIDYDKRELILSRIMYYFTFANNNKMGKNIYVHVEPEDVILYETILSSEDLLARKILPLAKIYAIDCYNYLSLFDLKRETQDIKNAYYNNWLYYASFSPVWKKRIVKHKGVIDVKNKNVVFDDDHIDKFYDYYGYEPDEQKKDVENKTIQDIRKERTWQSFYNEHNKNGIVEVEDDILISIDKIVYTHMNI